MKSFPPELVYILLFAAIFLFQFLTKRIGKPEQQEPEQQEPEEQQDYGRDELFEQIPAEVKAIPAAVPLPGMAVGHFGRTEVQRASPVLAPRRFSRRSLLGTKREVQNAVVIAAIVGPCRAFEPHDTR